MKLIIPGQRDAARTGAVRGGSTSADSPPATDLLEAVQVVGAFSLSETARARAGEGARTEIDAQDDDILEIEVEGVTFWTSVARYRHELAIYRPEALSADGLVVDGLSRPSARDRGIKEWSAGAVRLLRLGRDRIAEKAQDPETIKAFAKDCGLEITGKVGGWLLTKLLIWVIERSLRPREGLYTWDAATRAMAADAPEPMQASFDGVDVQKPLLVFLHGTGSSSRGSFGEFEARSDGAEWRALVDRFGAHIYAFEHRTMSRSPIENAIVLAERLPAQARLNLVSHSRGGLIGDLLCLPPLTADQIASVGRDNADLRDADAHDRACLRRLSAVLAEKQFRIERYARCACPARGTLLASENLDEFLSILTNLIGLVPALAASPAYDVISRITLEAAKNRWQPGVLPGLEAMTPSSPLVRLLNTATADAAGALAVIAGDIQGGNWLKRIGVFITDRFIYENQDNDLVVNTDSMFRGARHGTAHYVYDQGSDVSHFNYFKNARTRGSVAQWITGHADVIPDQFRPLEEAQASPVPMARAALTLGATGKPVVILVPGMMGSDLWVGDRRVWLDAAALADGAVGLIANVDAPGVEVRNILGESYHDLHETLLESHEVVTFAYDWRRSIVESARALRDEIRRALDSTKAPVRIVAHGMGGLLVRAVAAMPLTAGPVWTDLCSRAGANVVLLGVPHGGAYDSVEALLGTNPVVQQVALLDATRGVREVVEIVQGFASVLELLPRNEGDRFFTPDTWRVLRGGLAAAAPAATALRAAQKAVASFDVTADMSRVVSVVGSAPRTVCGVSLRDGQIVFDVTTEGDGRVTYASSGLPGVATYYMDAVHGELPSHKPGFPALLELLERGTTGRLPTVAPSVSRGGAATYVTRPEGVLYPTSADLESSVLGRRRSRSYRVEQRAGFRVSVMHGDLRFARFPILVGHYEGDTIVGAEAQVDRVLKRALRTRYNLGLYPGPLGSVAVVLRRSSSLLQSLRLPSGAIVVGLGRWGELTAAQIANLVRKGALQYVLQLDDTSSATSDGGSAAPLSGDVGLSVLLIGSTSAANISIDDSVAAILRGVAQANEELDTLVLDVPLRIGEVEIIELYIDTAIQAARSTRRLARALGEELNIDIEAAPLLQRGRYGRVRLTAPSAGDAWRRWEISVQHTQAAPPRQLPAPIRERLVASLRKADVDAPLLEALVGLAFADPEVGEPVRELRFVSLSDRARAEVMLQQRQPELIDRLVRASIASTAYSPDHARALFELMVPNDLKDSMGQLSRVVFVVDGETSQYPWELMNDGAEQPLCARLGMVRQLQTMRYRPQIRATTARTAFVVGDPQVSAPFRQLPGAATEARVVADLLAAQRDFVPTHLEGRPTAIDVLGALFRQPYRILHLAGHGYYEPPSTGNGRARSGMVLDNGVFLTAVEIGQMQQVPELVFLNCCFIGQTGPDVSATGRDLAYNKLAASISRELIEMGVRAVVAAGWAVRDDAALHFAKVFYGEMLDRATFGRALQEARSKTFSQFPDCNTWGAYQAYGDPDFKLTALFSRGTSAERVAHEELLEVLQRVREDAVERNLGLSKRTSDADVAKEVAELRRLQRQAPAEWLRRGEVLVAFGLAFGELGALADAVASLVQALDTGEMDSRTTVKAVEQLANFETRLGMQQAKAATDGDRAGALAAINRAITRLGALRDIAGSSERLSLLGGSYKALAVVSEGAGARAALEKSIDCYEVGASAQRHDRQRRGLSDRQLAGAGCGAGPEGARRRRPAPPGRGECARAVHAGPRSLRRPVRRGGDSRRGARACLARRHARGRHGGAPRGHRPDRVELPRGVPAHVCHAAANRCGHQPALDDRRVAATRRGSADGARHGARDRGAGADPPARAS